MKTRYPGAQPFSDDAMSRKLFFGRDRVARLLTDQILAKRMIVLYAKSGLGKTSLLNAAVAPQLRDEGHLPLIVRVNDVEKGPYQSVLDGIRAEAARQQVEYVPGDADTLWSFFKTSEFWRGDLLLVPVLILDQFEEIFTLQGEEQRTQFLTELSYLVRGVPPPSSTPDSAGTDSATADLSRSPPLMHIVLSLREDYLGFLEEAADQIPQILDARFRLAPLDLQAAQDAITKPASLDDPALNTRPFTFDQDAVKVIFDFLSKRKIKSPVHSASYVEPFQLQLICRRLEQLVERRQQESGSPVTITTKDVEGEAAIPKTLKDFYIDTIQGLPRRRERNGARRLCEDYLISPEGRRLSVEENEIHLKLNLRRESLRTLVASRLLRCENRSDSVYYELSHDSLLIPILSSKRAKSIFLGWTGFCAGLIFLLLSIFGIAALVFEVINNYILHPDLNPPVFSDILALILIFSALVTLFFFSATLVRNSARFLNRYWNMGMDTADIGPAPAFGSLPAWAGVVAGSFFLFASLVGITQLAWVTQVYLDFEPWPSFPLDESDPREVEFFQLLSKQIKEHGIGLDVFSQAAITVAMAVFGIHCILWSVTRFARRPISFGNRFDRSLYNRRRAWLVLAASAKGSVIILFSICLVVYIVVRYMILDCAYEFTGYHKSWMIYAEWFTYVGPRCFSGYYEKHANLVRSIFDDIIITFVLLWVAIKMSRQVLAIVKFLLASAPDRPLSAPATH